jgi:tRNA-2-methylthio-N6-dimethylallyladenosine synthase
MPKTYHIWTMGCQMNEADSRRVSSELEHLGYQPIQDPEVADLVLLNTCVVKQQAEDRIYGRLGSLKTAKQKRPDMTLALMGCFVGVKEAPRLRKAFPFVDVFLPPSDSAPLMDFLEEHKLYEGIREDELESRSLRDAIQDADLLLPVEQRRANAVTAHVPVVLGCSHACSFCIIPYRRGRERSRQMADIVNEVRGLAAQGIREVMLLGQIVDRYGLELDDPTTLAALLRDIHDIDGLERIRFLTSHPNWMTDELIDTVAELPRAMPHFEVPIQAGNDEVLKGMRRGYSVSDFRKLVDRIRDRIPDAAINTDIIVGFPGESEEQFQETCDVCEDILFDKIHISKYSERPKTVAARHHPDDVSEPEKTRRWHTLDGIQRQILDEKQAAFQGNSLDVLVERHQKGRWGGRTPHNKLVFFASDDDLLGQTVPVTITHTTPYTMIGDLT